MSIPITVVVEDDPLVLPVITSVLADAGFKVFSACDSDSALRLLEELGGKIELLFTDVAMPGSFDGVGLAHRVDARWPAVAIVVSSGRVVPRASALPVYTLFLPKPFSADGILWSARRAMTSKGHQPPL